MKAYVITTGAVFGLLTVAHLFRIVTENRHLATDPVYLLAETTVIRTQKAFDPAACAPRQREGEVRVNLSN